jgi:hypothetical protein
MSGNSPAFQLSPQQELSYIYHIDQEVDWWPTLVWKSFLSEDSHLSDLMRMMVEAPEEWKTLVHEYKGVGKKSLK